MTDGRLVRQAVHYDRDQSGLVILAEPGRVGHACVGAGWRREGRSSPCGSAARTYGSAGGADLRCFAG